MRTSQRRSIRLVADLKPIRVREVYAEAAPSPEIATEQSILSDNRPPIEAPFLGLLGLFASITDNASHVAGDLLYVKGAILARSRSTSPVEPPLRAKAAQSTTAPVTKALNKSLTLPCASIARRTGAKKASAAPRLNARSCATVNNMNSNQGMVTFRNPTIENIAAPARCTATSPGRTSRKGNSYPGNVGMYSWKNLVIINTKGITHTKIST